MFFRCKYIILNEHLLPRICFFDSLTSLSLQSHQKPRIMPKKEPGYRKSIDEIEAILEKIENGETDIDDLTTEIKRAAKLLQDCKDKLFQTEQEVKKIMKTEE